MSDRKKTSMPAVIITFIIIFAIAVAASLYIVNHSFTVNIIDEPHKALSPAPTQQSVADVTPSPVITPEPVKTITFGNMEIPEDASELKLEKPVSAAEIQKVLTYLPKLSSVDLMCCNLSSSEQISLSKSFPDITFIWMVNIADTVYESTVDTITIPSPESIDAYVSSAELLPSVTSIKLEGGNYTPENAAEIISAWPDAIPEGTITMFGKSFSADSEELDFSNIRISLEETDRFADLVKAMPSLKKVIMSDCGIKDEDMDALNKSYENVQFVWTVYFKVYSVRTDTDRFCASDLPWNNYVCWPMYDFEFAPLKYCHDIVALDVGHENVSDLSFLYEMPKLRYLILATVHNTLDLTAIASLEDLYYLEVFHNPIVSLEPLLECKNLKHLNIGNCTGDFSLEPLLEMKQLDRMWYPMNRLSAEQIETITAALPDTELYFGNDDEVAGGWRDSEVYHELRAALFVSLR